MLCSVSGSEIEDDDEPDEEQDAIDYIDAEDGSTVSKSVSFGYRAHREQFGYSD